jgi:hypothetical protein
MGSVDKVLRDESHDIFNGVAMQQTQFNFVQVGTLLLLLAAAPAWAATMAGPAKPDPLLDGGPTAPCAQQAEYAAGSDANGHLVPPADIGAGPVPMPDTIAVPLHAGRQPQRRGRQAGPAVAGDSTYVSLDGRRLEPLVNPPPCLARPHR